MKKILILMALLGTYASSFAFLTQNNWRWRNNDGSETTATWKAPQNTAITYTSIGEILRLRVEVYNNESSNIDVLDSLQYSTTPLVTTSWVNIRHDDPSGAFMLAGPNGFVTEGELTTAQLTGVALPFSAGRVMVDSSVVDSVPLPTANRTEFEWAIRGTANLAPNTVYYFRHWGSTANNLPPGIPYPSLTTSAVLPLQLSGFSVKREDRKVKLEWSTSSEQNNDRFEIQRSSNGTTWQTISSVKGRGTSSVTNNYSTYDDSPLAGINYYRLKQFDVNGEFSVSIVKTINILFNNKPMVSITPNPTPAGINFKLENLSIKNVSAILSDIHGKVIFRETFKDVQENAINKLSLKQQPLPGVYILKLKAAGLSESLKVIVE